MTTPFNYHNVIRSLSILICALFLLVSVAKDFTSKSKSNASYLESLGGQHFSIAFVKGLQPFPVKEPSADIASATLLVGATNYWTSVPKTLLVNLFERNSFYVNASINAP